MSRKFLCKCGNNHSLTCKSTKEYDCGTIVVGTEWDTSSEIEDRVFLNKQYLEPPEIDKYADSLSFYLKDNNIPEFLVTIGHPSMGKWKAGCLVVLLFEEDSNIIIEEYDIPLTWCGCPVLVEIIKGLEHDH